MYALRKPTSRQRILVVDDNRDAAHTLGLLLQVMEQHVKVALNGETAVRMAAQFRPEIVFVDLVLPDADGCDLARELREQAKIAGARIVLLTGYDNDKDRLRAKQAGCDAYLLKPIYPETLELLLGCRKQRR